MNAGSIQKIILEQPRLLRRAARHEDGEAKKSAEGAPRPFGNERICKQKLDTLSRGNQQKIQLICTLLTDPDIIILLMNPSPVWTRSNAMMLKDIVKERIARGKIVLFSSHQMNYIEEFCDDIAILNQGEIVLSAISGRSSAALTATACCWKAPARRRSPLI